MVIISKAILREFSDKHPWADNAIEKWYDEVSAADWKDFADLKQTFNSTDSVGNDRYVFNIKGNHLRLVAMIFFKVRTVFILFIGTHSEYDKIKASEITYKT